MLEMYELFRADNGKAAIHIQYNVVYVKTKVVFGPPHYGALVDIWVLVVRVEFVLSLYDNPKFSIFYIWHALVKRRRIRYYEL